MKKPKWPDHIPPAGGVQFSQAILPRSTDWALAHNVQPLAFEGERRLGSYRLTLSDVRSDWEVVQYMYHVIREYSESFDSWEVHTFRRDPIDVLAELGLVED